MSKTSKLVITLLLAALLIGACGAEPEPLMEEDGLKGNITLSGAFALYPMVTRWAEEFQKVHPGVTFDISAGGAGKGMIDALSGAVDIGMVSRAVTKEEEAQGVFAVAVVKDAVFPMVNVNNPVIEDIKAKGITQETFVKIYITGEISTWGEAVGRPDITEEIHIYTHSDSAGAAEMWAKFLGDKKQEDLLGVGANADPGLLEAVRKDANGIGYNNLGYIFELASGKPVDGVVAAPIDLNNNGVADPDELIKSQSKAVEMIAAGKYPSPPARPLNLVTNGKPGGLALAFIEWALTDGQHFVGEAGYVPLSADELAASLEFVK